MDNLFEIKNVSKSFAYSTSAFSEDKKDFFALKDVSLNIKKNEILASQENLGAGKQLLQTVFYKS